MELIADYLRLNAIDAPTSEMKTEATDNDEHAFQKAWQGTRELEAGGHGDTCGAGAMREGREWFRLQRASSDSTCCKRLRFGTQEMMANFEILRCWRVAPVGMAGQARFWKP